MGTIFRKVMCSDTNPKSAIDSAIITNKGLLWWNGLNWHDRQSRIVINPDWWLEKVELPRKKDMNKLAEEYENKFSNSSYYGFRAGWTKAIELIKGDK